MSKIRLSNVRNSRKLLTSDPEVGFFFERPLELLYHDRKEKVMKPLISYYVGKQRISSKNQYRLKTHKNDFDLFSF